MPQSKISLEQAEREIAISKTGEYTRKEGWANIALSHLKERFYMEDGFLYNKVQVGLAREGEKAGAKDGKLIIDNIIYRTAEVTWMFNNKGVAPEEVYFLDGDHRNFNISNLTIEKPATKKDLEAVEIAARKEKRAEEKEEKDAAKAAAKEAKAKERAEAKEKRDAEKEEAKAAKAKAKEEADAERAKTKEAEAKAKAKAKAAKEKERAAKAKLAEKEAAKKAKEKEAAKAAKAKAAAKAAKAKAKAK